MSSRVLTCSLLRARFHRLKWTVTCTDYSFKDYGEWSAVSTNGVFQALDWTDGKDWERSQPLSPEVAIAPYRPFSCGLHHTLNPAHRDFENSTLRRTHSVCLYHATSPRNWSRLFSTSFGSLYAPQRGVHGAGLEKEEDPSVMEQAVTTLKQKKNKEKATLSQKQPKAVAKSKPPLLTRVKEVLLHYYHGSRLFVLDMRVAFRLLLKTVRGQSLSRREQRQFRRTAGDLFRMVPFSVFLVIPFMEFLLPVYLWYFPNALPSTFQSESAKKARKKQELKVKLKMAKFLQDTIEEMAVSSKNPSKMDAVREFGDFFDRIRTSGAQADTEEILKFSKLFQNEITLDNLSKKQLQALCRLVLLPTIGSSQLLRLQLQMKMRQIKADDKMILKEGIDSLTVPELQAACQARGMRALGMPVERLKSQLKQWVQLHLKEQIPMSLLLFSCALYLPEDVPTPDVLKEALSKLPENILDEAEVLVASTSGELVDNRTRADVVREHERMIMEENQERDRESTERKKESQSPSELGVAGVEAVATDTSSEVFSSKEIQDLSQAVSSLKPVLEEEREVLREIKEDREEYREDIADLALECSEGDEKLEESLASERLGRKVEAMLDAVDMTLGKLERDFVSHEEGLDRVKKQEGDTITLQQLESALSSLQGASCEAKHRSLFTVLDEDHDGNINLDEMAEVIEALAKEGTDISRKQIAQIKTLIKLEEKTD